MHSRVTKVVFGLIVVAVVCALSAETSAESTIERVPLKVVHLGDSYSAGNGARSDNGSRNYHGVAGCYRSPTNWGGQFVESLKDVYYVTYVNRACSGGVIADISGERKMDTYIKGLLERCPLATYPDEEEWKETTPLSCVRYLKPQSDAIDESVDLVLMTMGGNDVYFESIVKRCFALYLRGPDVCRGAVDEARSLLPTVEADLLSALNSIGGKLRSDAKVVLVTYPYLVPNTYFGLGNRLTGRTYDVAEQLRALQIAADIRQRSAVNAANSAAGREFVILYDKTKELFAGHEPDPSTDSRNTDRWLYEFETRVMMEWYHYNPIGHRNLGRALSVFESFDVAPESFEKGADIDIALVVDTTGSMGGEIGQVRADLSRLVNQLAATTNSYRVAVVSYRDFSQRTGTSIDYPSRVDQTFTNDLALIQSAINSLSAAGGGDLAETVFSGIQAAIELPWRPGVTKIAIVIGDAPALSPEPISGLTAAQIVANSIAVDPVQVFGVNTGGLNNNGALEFIASRTGGSLISGTANLTDRISDIFTSTAEQPFAWLGTAYAGKIGEPIVFDASGSYDPSGLPLSRYEWDFNGDGVFDLETTEASLAYVYETAFDDYAILRVTGSGGTALASVRVVVNELGYVSQGDEAPCELDAEGVPIIFDEEGRLLRCTPDRMPTSDREGITVRTSSIVYLPLLRRGNTSPGVTDPAPTAAIPTNTSVPTPTNTATPIPTPTLTPVSTTVPTATGTATQTPTPSATPVLTFGSIVRIEAGNSEGYIDASSTAWTADKNFVDGNTVDRGNVDVTGTNDPRLYQTERWGLSGYAIPVINGTYTVRLHFAETSPRITQPGQRVFGLNVEGTSLGNIDIVAQSGGQYRALVKAVNVAVTDGQLNIDFTRLTENPAINAIEVIPTLQTALRIQAGTTASYLDSAGVVWVSDTQFLDGNTVDRGNVPIANTTNPRLYQTERWGLTGYALPVANGRYQVRLHFAETSPNITQAGQRVFGVAVEGSSLGAIDVFAESGGQRRALVKTVTVDVADGQLNIAFSRQTENPIVNAIEIIPVE